MHIRHTFFFAIIALFSMMGCSAGPKGITPMNASHFVENQPELPEYRLGFGDVIQIKFFVNTQFNETLTVRPDGRISLQRVGELFVSGLTPTQVDSIVTETYAEFVLDPDVTVIVREFTGYQFYVLGEVENPGGFPIRRNMTLFQALAVAGGPRITAKTNNIMVFRRDDANRVAPLMVDMKELLSMNGVGKMPEQDVFMRPYDIIFIPKTRIASVSQFMGQFFDGVAPPINIALQTLLLYSRFNNNN